MRSVHHLNKLHLLSRMQFDYEYHYWTIRRPPRYTTFRMSFLWIGLFDPTQLGIAFPSHLQLRQNLEV